MADKMCKCPSWLKWLTLIVGILYLIADIGWFDWGISWWTAAFVLAGLCCVTK